MEKPINEIIKEIGAEQIFESAELKGKKKDKILHKKSIKKTVAMIKSIKRR